VAARGASAAFGGFGFALKTAATFDNLFNWLQVTNYGVLYVLFDSAPSGSNYIDVWERIQKENERISTIPFFALAFFSRRQDRELLGVISRGHAGLSMSSLRFIAPRDGFGVSNGPAARPIAPSVHRPSPRSDWRRNASPKMPFVSSLFRLLLAHRQVELRFALVLF